MRCVCVCCLFSGTFDNISVVKKYKGKLPLTGREAVKYQVPSSLFQNLNHLFKRRNGPFVTVHGLVVLTASNQRAETETLLKFRAIPMTKQAHKH